VIIIRSITTKFCMMHDETSNVSLGHAFLKMRVISWDATMQALPKPSVSTEHSFGQSEGALAP
jgi:hypothetical protein